MDTNGEAFGNGANERLVNSDPKVRFLAVRICLLPSLSADPELIVNS